MANDMPRVLAMVAHPDDESFGLGAVLAWLSGRSVPVSAVVFTHGEASSLIAGGDVAGLGDLRSRELECASRILGLADCKLYSYPDGKLNGTPIDELSHKGVALGQSEVILAFDDSGVTGHPDHIAATQAAQTLAIEIGASLYLWTLPEEVADELNARFNTSFIGRPAHEISVVLDVAGQREIQWEAIHCHHSQSGAFDLVRARLELLGDREYLIERSVGTQTTSPFGGQGIA